jgi:hypothetical protein
MSKSNYTLKATASSHVIAGLTRNLLPQRTPALNGAFTNHPRMSRLRAKAAMTGRECDRAFRAESFPAEKAPRVSRLVHFQQKKSYALRVESFPAEKVSRTSRGAISGGKSSTHFAEPQRKPRTAISQIIYQVNM